MKKILLLSLPISMLACNNNAGNASHSGSEPGTASSTSVNKIESAGPCNKLIFFRKGAEIESTTYSAAGKEISKQITKVLTVKMENGMTVADVEGNTMGATDDTKKFHYSYKCDGTNIYFDIASMFSNNAKNQNASFESSLIAYPLTVTEGEKLPDMTGTMNSESNGKKMQMKYHYTDRKVEAKEEITTAAGTWNCYRITNTISVELEMPGMDEASKKIMESMKEKLKTTATTWLAPDFGIVKMEMYMGGKLTTRNEITAVRK